ncbi:MAG: VWA domain-containing protein [Syntrophobacteraceae bacterium]|jgi:magnesium chelatase subunit D|nr:VWA domain-containing protein [Syntrophobacteraceae bacterium]MCU0588972.1 VWA domain-containing protein [Syntrophobacteraceae bacterium]
MIEHFPFSALVGQDLMKRALLLNVIDPSIGGVLIKGERGTAKSTGVRALIDLLPTIRVVSGCPFQCDPDNVDGFCPYCEERRRSAQPLQVMERSIRLVNLPIGTTEDRLLGTIDIEKALKSGQKAFEPGLLAEAHRGILYVDEVNLLNDQIVDLFLDAAASGRNLVEREGISFSHASRFVLVGTMNPEEGDLRPQLLDRFGLSVNIEGIHSIPERVEIIKRRLSFEQDPNGFRASWASRDAELARGLVTAKGSLARVTFSEAILETAAKLAMAMETDGHRADIVMMKTARANTALEGRLRVTSEDLQLAARLALPHRIRKSPLRKAELNEDKLQEILSQSSSIEGAQEEWSPIHQNPPRISATARVYQSPVDAVTHLCAGSRMVRPDMPWYRIMAGSHPGKRFVVPDPQRGGAVHGSRLPRAGDPIQDLSIIATLRAAAPRQPDADRRVTLRILAEDLRLRKRSRKTGLSLMMIVDSSASMRTNDRMSVTKGIIEALFQDLYIRRDKLGIITFRHTGAELILPLSQNIRDAVQGIERLPVGGRTPLAAGLDLGIRLLTQEKRKNPETLPVMLIFSDGRPNVSCYGGDPLEEALRAAEEVRRQGIQAILVDTEFNPMSVGYGYEITQRMAGTYLTMDQLYRK